jgi:signal transduction histidine kinase
LSNTRADTGQGSATLGPPDLRFAGRPLLPVPEGQFAIGQGGIELLVAVVNEAVDGFHARALASGISLVADIVSSSPVAFDPARILQVLTNLLSNAIKFTPADGKVVVRVERSGDEIRFAVTDTGVGIPPTSWKRCLCGFFRSPTTIGGAWDSAELDSGDATRNAVLGDGAAATSGDRRFRRTM